MLAIIRVLLKKDILYMKDSKIFLLETMASFLGYDPSVRKVFHRLYKYELIKVKEYDKILYINKDGLNLNGSLEILAIEKGLINNISFYSHHYSLQKSILIAIKLYRDNKVLRNEMLSSLAYPSILIFISSIAIFFVINYIVPQLINSIEDIEKYKLMIFILSTVPIVIISIIVFTYMFYLLFKFIYKYKPEIILNNFNKLIILNSILRFYISLKFASFLKEIINNITFNADAIKQLKVQCNDLFIIEVTRSIIINLEKGEKINDIIMTNNFLSKDIKRVINTSVHTKDLYFFLENYCLHKRSYLRKRVRLIVNLSVPIIISFVGLIIVLLYLMIMLPILDLTNDI